MTRSKIARQLAALCWLVLLWLALMGSLAPDTVVAGVLVGAAVIILARLPALPRHSGIRWQRLPFVGLRLIRDLVMSSVEVTVATLRRGRGTHASILAVEVPPDVSDAALAVACHRISLEPGSLVIDLDREQDLVFVYQLDTREPGAAEKIRERSRAVVDDVVATLPPRRTAAGAGEGGR